MSRGSRRDTLFTVQKVRCIDQREAIEVCIEDFYSSAVDLNQLQAFDQIVKTGSFVKAADELNLAQATISARIRNLEDELGGALFIRGRQVKLTERGKDFLDAARRALVILEGGKELFQSRKSMPLRVAATESLGAEYLSGTIRHFAQALPGRPLFAQSTTCTQVMRMLQDRIIQFGLIPWPYEGAPPELQVLRLYREPVVAVTFPGHPLAGRSPLTLQDLREEARPWLSSWLDAPADRLLQLFGLDHTSDLNVPAGAARYLMLSGLGAALLNYSAVARDLEQGHLVALELHGETPSTRDFALVHAGDRRINSLEGQAFVEATQATAAQLGIQQVLATSNLQKEA